MKAVTLSYDMGEIETAGLQNESDILGENTGDASLAALLGESNGDSAGIGESLGALAGAGLEAGEHGGLHVAADFCRHYDSVFHLEEIY